MGNVENQHYVARLYLRQFAYEKGKNPHTHAFDKTTRRTIRPSIKTMASDLNFYGPPQGSIERLLGQVETEFTQPYQRLREAPRTDAISSHDRIVVSLYLAAQLVRTQEFREHLKSFTSQLDRWAKHYGHNLDPSYTTITEDDCRTIQASSIVNMVPDFAETMGLMKWIRLSNQTKMPFWTSDHPINFFNPRVSEVRGTLGLKCRGIQVFFPLSPIMTLCLCDPVDYGSLPGDLDITDTENVTFQNSLQVRESTRFVFSRTNDFSLAQSMLAEFPQFGDPDRPRMQTGGLDAP